MVKRLFNAQAGQGNNVIDTYPDDALHLRCRPNSGTPSVDLVSGWPNGTASVIPIILLVTPRHFDAGYLTYPVINPDMVVINVDLVP